MKKLLLACVGLLITATSFAATLSGTVSDGLNSAKLQGVSVKIGEKSALSEEGGFFLIEGVSLYDGIWVEVADTQNPAKKDICIFFVFMI